MKLLDTVFDRAVELAKPVRELSKTLEKLAEHMHKLAVNVAALAHNQVIHAQAINQISATQQAIFNKLNENALDTSMPEIKTATSETEQSTEHKSDKKSTTISGGKKTESKPN